MLVPQWGVSLPKVATRYNKERTAYTYTMQQRLTYQPRSTHAYEPVGLALPPLTRFASYSQAQYVCLVLDLGRAHKDTYGLLVETGPHYLTQAIQLSLVPSSTSHLTHFLFMFQLHVSYFG